MKLTKSGKRKPQPQKRLDCHCGDKGRVQNSDLSYFLKRCKGFATILQREQLGRPRIRTKAKVVLTVNEEDQAPRQSSHSHLGPGNPIGSAVCPSISLTLCLRLCPVCVRCGGGMTPPGGRVVEATSVLFAALGPFWGVAVSSSGV